MNWTRPTNNKGVSTQLSRFLNQPWRGPGAGAGSVFSPTGAPATAFFPAPTHPDHDQSSFAHAQAPNWAHTHEDSSCTTPNPAATKIHRTCPLHWQAAHNTPAPAPHVCLIRPQPIYLTGAARRRIMPTSGLFCSTRAAGRVWIMQGSISSFV